MPRTKKETLAKAVSRTTQSSIDFSIEDRLLGCSKKEPDQIIYVGMLVERVLKGEFGAVLKALTAGRAAMEIATNQDGRLSSERVLGRIEMANNLWNDLEKFVEDKDFMLEPQTIQKKDDVSWSYQPN